MISLKYSSLVLSLVCVGCRSLSANTPDQDIPEPKATALAWVDQNVADLKKLNRPLSELIQRNLMLVGAPVFDDAEKSFARKTQEPLVAARGRPIEMPLPEEIDPLPDEPDLIRASTDVGDVSWMVPTGGFRVACYTYGAPGHSWQIVACTGMSIGEKGLVVASRVMSASAIEILGDVDLLAAAQKDFVGRREGIPYTSLIPKDQKAPLKIR